MIVCLRTVNVPPETRAQYLAWIAEGRAVREAHGLLAELVLRYMAAGSLSATGTPSRMTSAL